MHASRKVCDGWCASRTAGKRTNLIRIARPLGSSSSWSSPRRKIWCPLAGALLMGVLLLAACTTALIRFTVKLFFFSES